MTAGISPRGLAVHLLLVPLLLVAVALRFHDGTIDLALARLALDPGSAFAAWRQAGWVEALGHQAARALPVVVVAAALALAMASAFTSSLRRWRPILLTLAAAMTLGPLLVNVMKTLTTQPCPVELVEFGGSIVAVPAVTSFWATGPKDAGHCLPSGHAGGGYALLALYFAGWAANRPRWRWTGLAIGVGAGLLFSAVRMLQGAHFASATIWSAAIDWTVCCVLFAPLLVPARMGRFEPAARFITEPPSRRAATR